MPRKRFSETDKQLLRECRLLVNSLNAEKVALLNPDYDATMFEYSRREGHVPKKKRGGTLTDYSAIEVLNDLRDELSKHNLKIERIIALYLYLKRLVNA